MLLTCRSCAAPHAVHTPPTQCAHTPSTQCAHTPPTQCALTSLYAGIVSELRPRLEHAILQRTKPPHRAVQLSVSQSDGTSKTLSVALRKGDNLEALAYTCLVAHELPISQHQDLAKVRTQRSDALVLFCHYSDAAIVLLL